MKLLDKIITADCPERKAALELSSRMGRVRANTEAATSYVAELERKRIEAMQAFLDENTMANFKAFTKATGEAKAAATAQADLGSGINLTEHALAADDEATDILEDALVSIQRRLSDETSKLSREESERLKELGLDPQGESPALQPLRTYLASIKEALNGISNHRGGGTEGGNTTNPWRKYVHLLKL